MGEDMKLAIIYDPDFPKLKPDSYSQTYRDMFLSLIDRFDSVQEITSAVNNSDIDCDCIIFFDIHSSHEIEIKGIKKHPAVKYEYFNDPWQEEFSGSYQDGVKVHKLGAKQRSVRANERGIQYVICPYENLYYRYIDPHFDGELLWFPIAPDLKRGRHSKPLRDRKQEVLLNGHLWPGEPGFRPYAMRNWAYQQNSTTKVQHHVFDKTTPSGLDYAKYLATYAASLALCDTHICPKYSEIPLAGCVTFAQYQYDYEKMGFKDGESCLYVTKGNFNKTIRDFNNSDIDEYQRIADRGRELIENKWTAKHFANHIYSHCQEVING